MDEDQHKNDGIFQGKVIESLDNIKAFMVKVETAIMNLQNTKVDKTELTSYDTRLTLLEGKHETLKDAVATDKATQKGIIWSFTKVFGLIGVIWSAVVAFAILVINHYWK